MKHEFDHEFFREISKYETSIFLQAYANLNAVVYEKKYSNPNELFPIKLADYGLAVSGVLYLNHWTIRDIIFQKFKRGHIASNTLKTEIKKRDMFRIIGLYNDYENELAKQNIEGDYVFFSMFGVAEQQLRGQVDAYRLDKKRNEILFDDLDTEFFFNIELVINETLGMTRAEFRLILIVLISMIMTNGLVNPYKLDVASDVFDEEKIPEFWVKYCRVVKYYTVTSDFMIFHNLNLTRYRYLFAEYGDTCVLADGFMLEEKFADAELWLAREYYQNKVDVYGREYFPNQFGILFERYIEYIAKEEKIADRLYNVNIPEHMNRFFTSNVGKKVDYVLETDRYRLIIECKSGIKPVAVKDANTSGVAMVNFMKKIFDEGAVQIKDSIQKSRETNKTIVGVIVHSEKAFLKSKVKNKYLQITEQKELQDILLFDIHDFELLFSLLKISSYSADEIIDDYIKNETTEHLDFSQVVSKKYQPSSFLVDIVPFRDDEYTRFLTEKALTGMNKTSYGDIKKPQFR